MHSHYCQCLQLFSLGRELCAFQDIIVDVERKAGFKNNTHCDLLFHKQMQFMHFLLKFVKIEKGHVNKYMPLEHYSSILELGLQISQV
jgi:hypothetical protein